MLYRIDLGQAAQRRLGVSLEIAAETLSPLPPEADRLPAATPDRTGADRTSPTELVFFLPVWTPGSYLIREYSRHVSGVRARDESGAERAVRKIAKNRWAVDAAGLSGRLRLEWTVYAHELTVRTSYVTADWAFWNGACALLWPVGAESLSAEVLVELPTGWRLFAGSAAVEVSGSTARFRCDGLDRAVDTPCLAGPFEAWSFELDGREHRFVAAGLAGVEPPAGFFDDLRRVVATTASVFGGGLPYDRYTFLALFGADGRGGLEHLDSSTLIAPRTTFTPRANYEDFLALVAHEFLHVWNVKRMRPRELWDLDYERENYTRLLWVAEGFTAYFDDLLIRRAALSKPAAYLERLASHVRGLRANPGRKVQSLSDASFDAWILLYRPDENTGNATQNYYTNGALAAFVIDAEVRRASGGARSLDDVVRQLWISTLENGRGYDVDDVVRAVDAAAGRSLGDLVESLVSRPFEPDVNHALGLFGLRLEESDSSAPFIGVRFHKLESTIAAVEDGSPAADAGLCPSDEVLAVDGLRVTGTNWQSVWENVARPDRDLPLLVSRRGVVRTVEVRPVGRAATSPRIVTVDAPTESQLSHRESWLGSRSI